MSRNSVIKSDSSSVIAELSLRLKNLFNNRFVKNAGWISGCELINRVTRLVTAIVLARYLSPLEFGIAAIALTANDLIKVLAQNGVGAKIVQAHENELEAICQAAYRINWLFCGGLFLLQLGVACIVGVYYQNMDVAWMIAFLSIVYLFMPFGLVQAFLLIRANRLNVNAAVSATQTSIDNLITILFAIMGMGVWAIIVPKVLVAPIWLIGIRINQKWIPQATVSPAPMMLILNYGKNILGAEINKALRLHADNLLVAFFLGIEAAGIYFFAKNAGLGISLAFINAFNQSLFAHLCEFSRQKEKLRAEFARSLKIILFCLFPIILLQGGLAHWYVPVVFGEQWSDATTILMLLCFSALPRPFGEAASELLKAIGRVEVVFKWNMLFSLIFMLSILCGQLFGLLGVAIGVLLAHCLYPLFCLWSLNLAFNDSKTLVPVKL